jgi:SNF2 family DNA or RNA helicase
MKGLISEISTSIKKYREENNKSMVKMLSGCVFPLITYFRQSLVCPLIPITSAFLNFCDGGDGQSFLSKKIVSRIKSLELEEYISNKDSAKSSRIVEILKVISQTKKSIVFCNFRSVVDLLGHYITQGSEGTGETQFFTLSSEMSPARREEVIEEFRVSENSTLVLTFSIGAEGLNLQFCDTVLIADFWWNSASTHQAIARVLRPGQKSSSVKVFFFTSNTQLENCIFDKHGKKEDIINELMVGASRTSRPSMRFEDILELIELEDNKALLGNVYQSLSTRTPRHATSPLPQTPQKTHHHQKTQQKTTITTPIVRRGWSNFN